jgi:hypothetical protein
MTTIKAPSQHATLPGGASTFSQRIPIRSRYDNWIGGEYVAPVKGQYFVNPTPVTGQPSRPDGSGPTATTCIPLTRPPADTSSRASGGRTTA